MIGTGDSEGQHRIDGLVIFGLGIQAEKAPFHIDSPFRAHFQGIDTVGSMNRHAVATGDVAGNDVSGNRLAAFSEPDQHIVDTFDHDTKRWFLLSDTTDKLVEQ